MYINVGGAARSFFFATVGGAGAQRKGQVHNGGEGRYSIWLACRNY